MCPDSTFRARTGGASGVDSRPVELGFPDGDHETAASAVLRRVIQDPGVVSGWAALRDLENGVDGSLTLHDLVLVARAWEGVRRHVEGSLQRSLAACLLSSVDVDAAGLIGP